MPALYIKLVLSPYPQYLSDLVFCKAFVSQISSHCYIERKLATMRKNRRYFNLISDLNILFCRNRLLLHRSTLYLYGDSAFCFFRNWVRRKKGSRQRKNRILKHNRMVRRPLLSQRRLLTEFCFCMQLDIAFTLKCLS